MSITFDVKYTLGHSYPETWCPSPLYCPLCGKQEVFVNGGGGDYYVGEQHLCRGCGATFYLPNGAEPAVTAEDLFRLEQLKAKET